MMLTEGCNLFGRNLCTSQFVALSEDTDSYDIHSIQTFVTCPVSSVQCPPISWMGRASCGQVEILVDGCKKSSKITDM